MKEVKPTPPDYCQDKNGVYFVKDDILYPFTHVLISVLWFQKRKFCGRLRLLRKYPHAIFLKRFHVLARICTKFNNYHLRM